MGAQDAANFGTVDFGHSVVCERVVSFTVSLFSIRIENSNANNEDVDIFRWTLTNFQSNRNFLSTTVMFTNAVCGSFTVSACVYEDWSPEESGIASFV